MHTAQLIPIAALLLLSPLAQAQTSTALSALTASSDLALNTTTPTEDYIDENQRQFAALIASYEAQIAEFKSGYNLQLKSVSQQSGLIEEKLLDLEAYLHPLEVLSVLTKHCVQKYRGEVVTVQAIQSSIASCVATASSAWSTVISTTESTRRELATYISGTLSNGLKDCQRKFSNASLTTNYTLCVTQVIRAANTFLVKNRKSFDTNLLAAKCNADSRIAAAIDCAFSALYKAISTVGAVSRSIDNCSAQLAECASSRTDCEELRATGGRLPNNATRPNPFYYSDSNSTAPCAVVRYDFTSP